MIDKISTAISIIWLKLRHSSIKTKGIHHIRKGTEIVILDGGEISIGKGVSTHKRVTLSVVAGRLIIGDNTSFNRNSIIVCHDSIVIGRNCSFGPNLVIYDHDHVFDKTGFKRSSYHTDSIIIEDNCWIGANVTILKGTIIGEGSVIGAGSIVKGNIPPHSLVKSNRDLIITPIN